MRKTLALAGALGTLAGTLNAQDADSLLDLRPGVRLGYAELLADAAQREKAKPELSATFSQTFASKYRTDGGFTLSDGVVSQTSASATISGERQSFTLSTWANYDFKRGELTEVDFTAQYGMRVIPDQKDSPLGGTLDLKLSLNNWQFPSGDLGDHDTALIGRLNYNRAIEGDLAGSFDVNLKATQLLTSTEGREYVLEVGRNFTLLGGKESDVHTLSLRNYGSSAVMDNFFGATGVTNVQVGAGLTWTHKNFSMTVGYEHQEGLLQGFQDNGRGVISFNWNF